MTNKEAISLLVGLIEHCGEDVTIYAEDVEALGMATKALKEQRWIPCSKMLPEGGDTYLVSGVQEIDGEMVPFVDAANYPDSYIDGLWGTFTDWIEGNEVHVLAWQEMPEAWEGCDER